MSDPHFGHENIIRFTSRPFSNAHDMDKAIIDNINAKVGPDDDLWVLGDFCFGRGVDKISYMRDVLRRINCKNVHLILGNHDVQDENQLLSLGFASVDRYRTLTTEGKKFVLFHYPISEWEGYTKTIHLHGHVHNQAVYNHQMRQAGVLRYDVGVDANNLTPVSAKEIIEFFSGVVPTRPSYWKDSK